MIINSTNDGTSEVKMSEPGKPKTGHIIKVVGVGGAGGHVVSRLRAGREYRDFMRNLTTISVNTDSQDLLTTPADIKVPIGEKITNGSGAGVDPTVGRQCAEESNKEIRQAIMDSDILFIIAGMGGGIGTGAAPVVAKIARDLGILTISVPIYPKSNESPEKLRIADKGIEELRANSDGTIVVSNDCVKEKNISIREFYGRIDAHIYNIIMCIADIIIFPGERNFDPADLGKVVRGSKNLHVGIGNASGEGAIFEAVQQAMYNRAVTSGVNGATKIIVNVKSRMEYLKVDEIDEMYKLLFKLLDPSCLMINGHKSCTDYEETAVEVEIVASNYDEDSVMQTLGIRQLSSVKEAEDEPYVQTEPQQEVEEQKEQTEEKEVIKIPDFMKDIKIEW